MLLSSRLQLLHSNMAEECFHTKWGRVKKNRTLLFPKCTGEKESELRQITVVIYSTHFIISPRLSHPSLVPRPPHPAFVACSTYCKRQKLGVEAGNEATHILSDTKYISQLILTKKTMITRLSR